MCRSTGSSGYCRESLCVIRGDIEDERKEKASLVAHSTRLEKEVDSVKAASDEAVKAQARGEAERKALSKECERLKDLNAALVKQDRQVETQTALERALRECESTKEKLVATEGKWKDSKYEVESYKVKAKALQSRLDETISKGNQECELLMEENEAHTRVIAGLRGECEANNNSYLNTLGALQENVRSLRLEAQESRTYSRSLRARLTRLKSRVKREYAYNLDADDNLREELLRVFEVVGAQTRKVQEQLHK